MQFNDDLLFAAATFLAGLAIGWFLWDYSKRVPATSYYQQPVYAPPISYYGGYQPWHAQQQQQWQQPQPQPQVQPQPQHQPDRVMNDENVEVFYNRDGSIKNLNIHRDVRSA